MGGGLRREPLACILIPSPYPQTARGEADALRTESRALGASLTAANRAVAAAEAETASVRAVALCCAH